MSTLALCTLLVSGLGFALAFSPGSVCAGHVLVTSSAKALAEVQACSCEIAYTEHSLKEKVCELGYVCCGDSYEVDVSYSTAIEVVAIEKSIDPEHVPQDVMDAATASGASGCKSYQYELKNEKYEFDDCDGGIDYEVDANDLSVLVDYDDDTHPGADDAPPLQSGDFFGMIQSHHGLDPDGPWRWVTQGNNLIRGYIQKYNDPPVPARFGRA